MNYERPELIDKLASEYALGTLRGPARRRFRRLLTSSPAIQAAVRDWQARLAELAVSVRAVTPPAHAWSGIEHRLGWRSSPRELPRVPGWFARIPGLRHVAVFAFGLVLGLGIVTLMPQSFVSLDSLAQREQALPQSYVGLLTDREGRPTVLASATRHGKRMTLKILRKIEVPPGKVLQLWAFTNNSDGMTSAFPLGLIPAEGKGSFEMPASAERLLSKVSRLGVTLRDAPAGPDDLPGELLLSGHCVKLW